MRPQLAALCKVVAVQLAINPDFFPHKNPTLALVALHVGVCKQVLGRVVVDFHDRFPEFWTRARRSSETREAYRQAQLLRQRLLREAKHSQRQAITDPKIIAELHPQLTLF